MENQNIEEIKKALEEKNAEMRNGRKDLRNKARERMENEKNAGTTFEQAVTQYINAVGRTLAANGMAPNDHWEAVTTALHDFAKNMDKQATIKIKGASA